MSALIYSLIPKAMKLVGSIGKDRNNQGQGYKFRGIDDVYNAVNPVFAELGIFVVPRVIAQAREERQGKSGGVLLYTILTVEHEFFAPDGSSVKAVTVGEAMDSGDKSANKAMSAAMKYAVIEVLSIPTEADNDTENHNPEPLPKAPPRAVATKDRERFDRTLAGCFKVPADRANWAIRAISTKLGRPGAKYAELTDDERTRLQMMADEYAESVKHQSESDEPFGGAA